MCDTDRMPRYIWLTRRETQDSALGAPGRPRYEWRAEAGQPGRQPDFTGTGADPLDAMTALCHELLGHIDEEGL